MLWFVFQLRWKPDEVYRQSLRDLLIIQAAWNSMEH